MDLHLHCTSDARSGSEASCKVVDAPSNYGRAQHGSNFFAIEVHEIDDSGLGTGEARSSHPGRRNRNQLREMQLDAHASAPVPWRT